MHDIMKEKTAGRTVASGSLRRRGFRFAAGLAAVAAAAIAAIAPVRECRAETVRGSMRQGAKKIQRQPAAKPAARTAAKPAQKRQTAAPPAARKKTAAQQPQNEIPVQTQFRRTPYVGAISADAATGRIVFSDNASRKAYPASVTKLMTALLVLEDVEQGKYRLTDKVVASLRAANEEPSGVGFRPNQSMTVDDLLMALMVRSANDAAVALAEHAAGGDLIAFIARMNARAASLGMADTKYDSPNGLPPYDAKRRQKKWRHGYDVSTAEDVMKLAREIVRHPQIFKYTSTKVATVTDGNGKPLTSVNHNNILVKDKMKILGADGKSEVDGLKTGYINDGGSSIALTGTRNGRRAIVVVLGSSTTKERDANARALMVKALEAVARAGGPAAQPAASAPETTEAKPTPAQTAPAEAKRPEQAQNAAAEAAEAGSRRQADASAPQAKGAISGWLLVGGAVCVAAAAYGAWKWLGRDDRDRWTFEDVPPGPAV